jgi:cytosine/adenosine deaminase-related metal-dependent hydrolase
VTTVVRGGWVLASEAGGVPQLLRDHSVVVEEGRIAAVTPGDAGPADVRLEVSEGLVLPGFLNLHAHSLNARIYRGLVDDVRQDPATGGAIYGILMPAAELIGAELSGAELGAIARLGLLDLLQSGVTTVADMFRPEQTAVFEAAGAIGLRLYAFPYLFSHRPTAPGLPAPDDGAEDVAGAIARSVDLIRRFDQGAGGRVRVGLGPHGTDTCSPALLRAVRETATRERCPVSIHLAQSPSEVEASHRRHGCGPVEHLGRLGLLGADLLAAHCLYATDGELDLLARSRTTVVNCPLVFARWGAPAPFHRFTARGVRTAIGTDQERDYVVELRTAGLMSKLHAGQAHVASAGELLRAATLTGADALGRADLGRIEPGARADLVVVDLGRPPLRPAYDPVASLVWHATGGDVTAVLVDGEVLVEDGRFMRGDEAAIRRDAAAAIERVWAAASARGLGRRR